MSDERERRSGGMGHSKAPQLITLTKPPNQYRRYLEQAASGFVEPPELDESCIDPVDGQVRCQAGKASFWITWDGYMTPCGMMPEPKADVAAEGFQKAWAHTMQNTRSMQLSGVCKSCKDRFLCHCCASMAIAETDQPSGIPTYLCRMSQALHNAACQELEQLSAVK